MEGIKRELEIMANTVDQPLNTVKGNNGGARVRVASAIGRIKEDQRINNTELAEAVGCSSTLIGLLLKKKRPLSQLVMNSLVAKYNLSKWYFTGESEELYSGGFKGWKTELEGTDIKYQWASPAVRQLITGRKYQHEALLRELNEILDEEEFNIDDDGPVH